MDIKKLKEFIQLAKSEGVTELNYENKDSKFAVSFQTGQAPQVIVPSTTTAAVNNQIVSELQVSGDQFHAITSPFVGTFYSSPSPDKPIFVKVGDKVSKGQILCILEAMKIMNEIESDVNGEIVEICVDNESLVEFGQPLFKIKAS